MYIKMPLKIFERFRKQIAKHGNKILVKDTTEDGNDVILVASGTIYIRTSNLSEGEFHSIEVRGGTKHLAKTGLRIAPNRVRAGIYIEEAIYKTFKRIARKYGLNLSDIINRSLLSFIMEEYPNEYIDELQGRKYRYTI